jgi:hypothetical protein
MFTLEGSDWASVNVYHDGGILCGIYSPKTYCRRVAAAAMAESLQGSFSLDEFEASVIENVAAVPNLDRNTTCSCRGHCLRENGRNYCPCRNASSLGYCMNNRRALEDDSNTVKIINLKYS